MRLEPGTPTSLPSSWHRSDIVPFLVLVTCRAGSQQGAGSREQRAGSTGLPRSAEFLEYLSAVSLLCATASPPSRYILPRKAMALPADWRVKCGQQRQSDRRTVGIVGILETVKCMQQE